MEINNSNMEKEFVPYEQALALKKLGFDEPCFGCYDEKAVFRLTVMSIKQYYTNNIEDTWNCAAPTFSQCFRWFRDKYKLSSEQPYLPNIEKYGIVVSDMTNKPKDLNFYKNLPLEITNNFSKHNSKEEAELACLEKLIEIVKSK